MQRLTIFLFLLVGCASATDWSAVLTGRLASERTDWTASWRGRACAVSEEIAWGEHGAGTVQLRYADSVNSTGWGRLEVNRSGTATSAAEDEETMFVAGYLEGRALAARIWQMYSLQAVNAWGFDPRGPVPPRLLAYLVENIAWTWLMAGVAPLAGEQQRPDAAAAPLFAAVRLVVAHVEGQVAGYAQAAADSDGALPALDLVQLYMLHAAGDLEDLVPLLTGHAAARERDLDCSMLVKVTDDDLILGHTTWRQYGLMLRTVKQYRLGLTAAFNSHLSLTSSPGFGLESKDDFIVVGDQRAQLLVAETTLSVYNTSLFAALSPRCLLTWMRTVACSLVATDGDTWTQLFGHYPSYSYNNGFAVVDLKRYTGGLQPGAFWYVEQWPAGTQRGDLTAQLANQTYMGFYNVAYFPLVRQLLGYDDMQARYGDKYSYQACSRARIFRELQPLATTWQNVAQLVMRYNNYTLDPVASGNPTETISSRYDLRDANPDAFGGVDSKASSLRALAAGRTMLAQCGPSTSGGLPTFAWSTSPWKNSPHMYQGLPDVFDFGWLLV